MPAGPDTPQLPRLRACRRSAMSGSYSPEFPGRLFFSLILVLLQKHQHMEESADEPEHEPDHRGPRRPIELDVEEDPQTHRNDHLDPNVRQSNVESHVAGIRGLLRHFFVSGAAAEE